MATLDLSPEEIAAAGHGRYGRVLRGPRMGVMLHYDGSTSDAGGLAWFADPTCQVSYQIVVADDGRWAQIAPDEARAWHAGVCRTSDAKRLPYVDANSAFYGIAALTNEANQVTAAQMLTIAWLTWRYFVRHGWALSETWRIVGHDTEAWPRGRKTDPTGPLPRNPVLALSDVRYLVPRIAPPSAAPVRAA